MEDLIGSKRSILIDMVGQDMIGKITNGFYNTIRKSFESSVIIQPITKPEIQRRFDICMKWFLILRGDYKWSIPKSLDHLIDALQCELSGKDFEPSNRSSWIVKDSNLTMS